MKVYKYINRIGNIIWKLRILLYRIVYKGRLDEGVSVISSNCLGGVILHDLGLPFNSPTVNSFFYADDYIYFLKNITSFLDVDNLKFEDITPPDSPYPIALLNERVKINLMHYKSFEEAKQAYIRRCKRVNFDNIRVIMTERDGCNDFHIKQFDDLPFPYKVIFMKKKRDNISSGVYVPGFENEDQLSNMMGDFNIFGKKLYNYTIDWYKFIQEGTIKLVGSKK